VINISILIGLFTHLVSIAVIINMFVAFVTTKTEVLTNQVFGNYLRGAELIGQGYL
jgi:uncharacterized membrane protein YphA (DoxX/SURF4 family)